MKFENLYVNGCSFTAGHLLEDEKTWPFLIYENLKQFNKNLNFINDSKNGNSLDTIIKKSFLEIEKLNSNTLVIIGLTWPERYSISIEDFMINLTPADFDNETPNWFTKFSKEKRITYLNNTDNLNLDYKNYFKILDNFKKYVNSLIKLDKEYISNKNLDYLIKLSMFESFLIKKNVKYIFINHMNLLNFNKNNLNFNPTINNLVTYDFGKDKLFISHAHPNEMGCKFIKNIVMKKLEEIN